MSRESGPTPLIKRSLGEVPTGLSQAVIRSHVGPIGALSAHLQRTPLQEEADKMIGPRPTDILDLSHQTLIYSDLIYLSCSPGLDLLTHKSVVIHFHVLPSLRPVHTAPVSGLSSRELLKPPQGFLL